MRKGIEYGNPTIREQKLANYIGNCLADYMEKTPTERSELMCALTLICSILFTKQTTIKDVRKQCDEIDAFCECLKLRARHG